MEEFERPLHLVLLGGNLRENWKKFKRDILDVSQGTQTTIGFDHDNPTRQGGYQWGPQQVVVRKFYIVLSVKC